jgi:hypothetical protein
MNMNNNENKKSTSHVTQESQKPSHIHSTPEFEQQLKELQQTIEIPESTLQNIANTISKHY